MALLRRRIELAFILGTGYFGSQGEDRVNLNDFVTTEGEASSRQPGNVATVTGLRIKVHIREIGGPALGEASLRVYGLTASLLNQLSTIAQYSMFLRNNRVIVSAGDDVNGIAVVFEGTITQAWADMAQPDSSLNLVATAGAFYLAKPAPPSSFTGTADVTVVMESIAAQMGYQVENNGVSKILSTPYYPGTLVDQVRAAAAEANIDFAIIDSRRLIVIVPKGQARSGSVPLVSSRTGMVGYPLHDGTGVIAKVVFNRDISILGKVKIESGLPDAVGTWLVISVVHDLESETRGGAWFTQFQATTLDNPHAQPTIK